jgi:hypothetical protein
VVVVAGAGGGFGRGEVGRDGGGRWWCPGEVGRGEAGAGGGGGGGGGLGGRRRAQSRGDAERRGGTAAGRHDRGEAAGKEASALSEKPSAGMYKLSLTSLSSVHDLALDKNFLNLKIYFAECPGSGTRQDLFAECLLTSTRQRLLQYF